MGLTRKIRQNSHKQYLFSSQDERTMGTWGPNFTFNGSSENMEG
jgi:hypothetical protein